MMQSTGGDHTAVIDPPPTRLDQPNMPYRSKAKLRQSSVSVSLFLFFHRGERYR
jgi:hypothetical protein